MTMALIQKQHDPADFIKQGFNDGYHPSTRTMLKLGTDLCTYLRENGIKTISELVLLHEERLYEILSKRNAPPQDLLQIEKALTDVGLKLGMTPEEFRCYKSVSQP